MRNAVSNKGEPRKILGGKNLTVARATFATVWMTGSARRLLTELLPLSLQPDTEVLNVELTMFRQHCDDNMPDIKTVEDAARCARERQTIFPLTSRCFQLLLTAPITSASSERSFSKLKLIKTAIRSVMRERRLKDLITLGCEKDLTDTIDLDTVVDHWAELPKTQRLIRVK
jgi:hypothetical protein